MEYRPDGTIALTHNEAANQAWEQITGGKHMANTAAYKLVYTDVDGARYYQHQESGDIYHRRRDGEYVRATFTAEQNVYRWLRDSPPARAERHG